LVISFSVINYVVGRDSCCETPIEAGLAL